MQEAAPAGPADLRIVVDGVEPGDRKRRPPAHQRSFAHTGGLRICFQNLSYHVPSIINKGERAFLLKDISGFINPHEMTALMGPSGSGKTTLLDVLAGRKTAGKIEGSIEFGGQAPSKMFLRRYTGYVEQFDTLIGELTVQEMIMYTAEMKRPLHESLSDKRDVVESVLDKLALRTCRDTKIGNALSKGISGGQAKRVNIAIALVTHPRVLFLDEPTSGLDSYTSNEVMTVVKGLVNDGTTICATIVGHSPTNYCFGLFDRLFMLVRGQTVYFGPASGGMAFAQAFSEAPSDDPSGYNAAEYLVDFVTDADRQGTGQTLVEHYTGSELRRENDEVLQRYLSEQKEELPDHIAKELATTRATVTPWWWGLKTIFKYRTTKNYRNPAFLGPRIGDKALIALLVMTLYLGKGKDFSSSNIINIAAVLFMWCTTPAFGAAAYVPALVLERNLFVRERSDGLYHVITYLMAKMAEELLLAAVATVGISAYSFYGIQLQGSFAVYWLVFLLTLSNGIVLAYFIAAISPSMDVANALLPTYVVTLLFFSGFLLRLTAIPPWWKWYSYINFLRYAWGAAMINQFSGRKGDPQFLDNQSTLSYYGLDGSSLQSFLGFLALFFLFWFTCAWLALSFKKYSSR